MRHSIQRNSCFLCFVWDCLVVNEVWHLHRLSVIAQFINRGTQEQKWRNACTTCRFGTNFLLFNENIFLTASMSE